jgi:hypothetical protein
MIIPSISVRGTAEVLALVLQLVFTPAMHRLRRTESAGRGRDLRFTGSSWAAARGERDAAEATFSGRVSRCV